MAGTDVFDVAVVGGVLPDALSLRASPSRRHVLCSYLRPGLTAARISLTRLPDGWTIRSDQFDWGYTSEPSVDGVAQNVRRTKLLGGTSWLTTFTPRGHPDDYDGWAALGNVRVLGDRAQRSYSPFHRDLPECGSLLR